MSYRESDKKQLKNLNRQQGVEEVSSHFLKPIFREWKTQTWMQSNMQLNQWSKQHNNLSKSCLNKNLKHMDLKNTH